MSASPSPGDAARARLIRLRVATIAVLTLLLVLFVGVKPISSRVLSAVPEYAPIIVRLPGYQPQSGDPIYIHIGYRAPARVDTAAIRRAARLVPDNGTFFVQAPESGADVVSAASLFFLPAALSRRAATADWILSYRSRPLPPGLKASRTYRLDKDLRLVKLRKR